MTGEQSLEEVARGLGRAQHLFGEAHAESLLQPAQKLDAAEAVEPQVALQGGVESEGAPSPALRLQLAGEALGDLQDRLGRRGRGGDGELGEHGEGPKVSGAAE